MTYKVNYDQLWYPTATPPQIFIPITDVRHGNPIMLVQKNVHVSASCVRVMSFTARRFPFFIHFVFIEAEIILF